MYRLFLLVGAVLLIVGSIIYLESKKSDRAPAERSAAVDAAVKLMAKGGKAKRYEPAKEISSPDGFINTESITIGELIGNKVVLVDFWTYSCINCQRTIPYLNAWYEKYKDKGFVILGVHTPEFAFEQKYDNVLAAVKKFGIQYPVVLDNDYSTWTAYRNRYWPRKYLIDIDGFIIYDHIGEGGYEETERKIQEALAERMARLGEKNGIAQDLARPLEAEAADPAKSLSPEIYFGAWRNELLGNGQRGAEGRQAFAAARASERDVLYLDGDWNITREYAQNSGAGAKIIFRYRAKKVFMVANSAAGVTVRVERDGKPLIDDAGADVKNGILRVDDDRLYEIVNDDAYGEHTLELLIEGPGLQAFTFTFG